MVKRNLIISVFICFFFIPVYAQVNKQETALKREVTLYNPYKPSLPDSKKRSFLPEISDTVTVRPVFKYEVSSKPFSPEYTISPIKAASLLPDPLTKLYKSFINIGLGNYLTPLAELSITNERSKKGAIGFYARHFSTNGKIELPNYNKVFAGYMDNDASLYGRKFFRKSLFESSVDLTQRTRYAYGYDTSNYDYSPVKEDIRMNYTNFGVKASYASTNTDSSSFSYKFDINYNYFYNTTNLTQHSAGIDGIMSKSFKGFYVGSGISYDYYKIPEFLLANSKFIASVSPFIKKRSESWAFKVGLQALVERNMTASSVFHLYPDLNIEFNIVPSYLAFYAGLSGKLEKNDPLKVISENPYILPDGSLFTMSNTDHAYTFSSGLRGNTGKTGSYMVSVSYSMINDMLFYSNFVFPYGMSTPEVGNHFVALPDDVDLLNFHGEMRGAINDKLSYRWSVNFYNYSLTKNEYAWNKPDWDALIGFNYNLREKIIAGAELTGTGPRKLPVEKMDPFGAQTIYYFETPYHINLNLKAEYRYSKILSFWARFNNISTRRYFEWAYYPTQRFLVMVGFTYSL